MPLAVDRPGYGAEVAMEDCLSVAYAPLLAILFTGKDDPDAWLAAGQALQRVLLRAAVAGAQASFLNQATHFPDLRAAMRRASGIDHEYPQLMLRMGYADAARPTPRRPVRAVLND
jgi:hypothetical protein